MKILITGGSGLVGRELTQILQEKGHEVAWLSRNLSIETEVPVYECNYYSKTIDKEAVKSAEVIIHLAGANIGKKRWSSNRKKLILDSRVQTANLIFETLKDTKCQLKTFISASAVGYYGAVTTEDIFTEESAAGNDFLAEVCKQWEKSADAFAKLGVRVVKMRSGVVLSKAGGALEKILPPFRLGAKVVLGSGKQYMPWIHSKDLCQMYLKAVEDTSMQGVYNAVAPEYVSYSNFMKQLKPYFKSVFLNIKVPAFVLRLIFGKMAVLLLEGSKIAPQRIMESGFEFKFPTLKIAFNHLLKQK